MRNMPTIATQFESSECSAIGGSQIMNWNVEQHFVNRVYRWIMRIRLAALVSAECHRDRIDFGASIVSELNSRVDPLRRSRVCDETAFAFRRRAENNGSRSFDPVRLDRMQVTQLGPPTDIRSKCDAQIERFDGSSLARFHRHRLRPITKTIHNDRPR